MAVRKRNVKAEKASKKKETENVEAKSSSWAKQIGVVLSLLALIMLVKVQYSIIYSEMVQKGDYKPGPGQGRTLSYQPDIFEY